MALIKPAPSPRYRSLIIVLLAFLTLTGCRISADDIRAMGARGDSVALSAFLTKNQYENSPDVYLAVHEVLSRRITGAYPALGAALTESSSELGAVAIAVLDSTGMAPPFPGDVLSYLSRTWRDDTLRAARVAARTPEAEHVAWFEKYIIEDLKLSATAYDDLALKARRHALVGGPRRDRFMRYAWQMETYANVLRKVEEVKVEVDLLGERLSPEAAAVESSLWLRGFVVADKGIMNGAHQYEVSSPDLATRAIVRRTDATFTSQGSFTLRVVQEGTVEVTLAPEFGGFTQTWPVFREVRQADVDAYNAFKAEARQVEQRMEDLRARLAALGEPRPL